MIEFFPPYAILVAVVCVVVGVLFGEVSRRRIEVTKTILKLGNNASGYQIRQATGFSMGSVYATLQYLVDQGYVSYVIVPGGEDRGGRPQRFFSVIEGDWFE